MKTTLEQLAGFLGKANKHTYAVDGVKAESSRTASDEFEYKERGTWLTLKEKNRFYIMTRRSIRPFITAV